MVSDYRALSSSRLFPVILPNRELSYCFFKFLYDKFLNSTYLTKVWIKELDLQFLFSSQRELHTVPNIDYFCWTITCFVSIGFIKARITKMYPKYFNGKFWPYHLSCFINYFSTWQSVRFGFLKSLFLSQKLLIVLKSLAFW